MLSASIRDFEALKRWLVTNERVSDEFLAFYLERDSNRDEASLKNPRDICYVEPGRYRVACAAAIDALPQPVRIGVLLHELGHHALDAFNDEDEEVDVDAWIMEEVPESGYTYLPEVPYPHPLMGTNAKPVVARNLQTVSPEFVSKIHG